MDDASRVRDHGVANIVFEGPNLFNIKTNIMGDSIQPWWFLDTPEGRSGIVQRVCDRQKGIGKLNLKGVVSLH